MFKKRITLLFFAMLFLSFLYAQENARPVCGIASEDIIQIQQRLLENKKTIATNGLIQLRDVIYVPVKFHVVAKNDGTEAVNLRNLLEQVCKLNKDFESVGMQFYIKDGLNFINNTNIFERHTSFENQMQTFRDSKAINVWIVENANTGQQLEGSVTLGYYKPSRDWLVIRKSETSGVSFVLSHEMGHFFDLLHTFNGWDFENWQLNVHGNPAPASSPQGVPTERQDGFNCDEAGDYLCDTRPDYNLGFGWSGCNYTGGAQDPTGTVIDPDERNFMGYFLNCSPYTFSEEQKSLILTDYNKSYRNYIRSTFVPAATQITTTPQLLAPASGTTIAGDVTFEWEEVPGATMYLLEIDRLSSFSIKPIMMLVEGTSQVVDVLEPNKTYHWRVRPINEYYTCSAPSASKSFKTSSTTALSNLDFVSNWSVNPNPASQDAALTLAFNTNESFEANLTLWSVAGQIVKQYGKQRFVPGQNVLALPTDALSAGMYVLMLQTEQGKLVEKIIIQ